MIELATVLQVLSRVRDPELDESITSLGFVRDVTIHGQDVDVRLRLPTYYCAPNFAFLMASDAKDAIGTINHVGEVHVRLEDHFATEEIDAGVSEDRDFGATFPGEAEGDLESLRTLFRRKAILARQEDVVRELKARGWRDTDLPRATLADIPAGAVRAAYELRLSELGIDSGPEAPVIITADGTPVGVDGIATHRRITRSMRLNVETNGVWCDGLLRTRYGDERGMGAQPIAA